jgi:hypothetical protein
MSLAPQHWLLPATVSSYTFSVTSFLTIFSVMVGHEAYLFQYFYFIFLFSLFSVCFETDMFVSVVSKQARNTETNRNKPKKYIFGFAKQTEKQPKQIEFRFLSVRTEKKICLIEDTLCICESSM